MNRFHFLLVLFLLLATAVAADPVGFQDELLDRLVGSWVMEGMIAGDAAVHDVQAEWVLAHQYLRFTDVARELDAEGNPAYEAIVFIGWDEPTGRYTNLWLDVTGSGGLSSCSSIGLAEPATDELAFLFDTGEGSVIHTTFTYDREINIWRWLIEPESDGRRRTFGSVTLTRP